jgi:hypothetical protein
MLSEVQYVGARAPIPPDGATPKRTLAGGDGWSLHEIVCRAGPSDRPFEERHDGFSVSAVVGGNFTYRSDGGQHCSIPARCCSETMAHVSNVVTRMESAIAAFP